MGLVVITRSNLPQKIKTKPLSYILEGLFSIVLPFGLCNSPPAFQRAILGIFFDLTHDCVEIYLDDFTVYGLTFEIDLTNLENVFKRCKETNLSLNHEKCHMLQTEGIVLGHLISVEGIKVDLAKIEVIVNLPAPKS